MLRTEYLYYFLAVAQTNSISAAAKKLHITTPAVSQALKNLENDLNLTLFTRTSRGVTLTEDGIIIARKIQKVIEDLDDLEHSTQQLKLHHQKAQPPTLEYLTLFSETSILDMQLPSISHDLYHHFKDLDLIVAEQPLPKALDEISNDVNAIALLLIGNDSLERIRNNYSDISIYTIDRFPLQLMAIKNSKWLPKELPDAISFDKLANLPLIKTDWISSTQYTYDALINNDEKFKFTAVAPTLSILTSFLFNDIGVCLGCKTPFSQGKNFSKEITFIPISTESPLHIEYCVLHNKDLSPVVTDILYAIIKENYNKIFLYSF